MGAINDTAYRNSIPESFGGGQQIAVGMGAPVRAVQWPVKVDRTVKLEFADLLQSELAAIEDEVRTAGPAGAVSYTPLGASALAWRVASFSPVRPAQFGGAVFGASLELEWLPGVAAP